MANVREAGIKCNETQAAWPESSIIILLLVWSCFQHRAPDVKKCWRTFLACDEDTTVDAVAAHYNLGRGWMRRTPASAKVAEMVELYGSLSESLQN